MERSVHALFDDRDEAARAIRLLKDNGFTDRELTVVATSDDLAAQPGEANRAAVKQDDRRAGAWAGSALGAAVAGSLGLLSFALIPAIPLLMVGGAAIGGAAGAIGGASLSEHQLREAEDVLRSGGVLVFVHEESAERRQRAKQLLGPLRVRAISELTNPRIPESASDHSV